MSTTTKRKILIHTKISKRDVSGNCYTFSEVENLETGKRVNINDGWGSDGGNVIHQIKKLLQLEYDEIKSSEEVLPIRVFNNALKYANAVYSHNLTIDMVK